MTVAILMPTYNEGNRLIFYSRKHCVREAGISGMYCLTRR